MSRDHRKLNVFILADQLLVRVYAGTTTFPAEERFGLCNQLRRAAVSAATNIVEGCVRRTTKDYLRFIEIAASSSAEAGYLLDVSNRLGFVTSEVYRELSPKYSQLLASMRSLMRALEHQLADQGSVRRPR